MFKYKKEKLIHGILQKAMQIYVSTLHVTTKCTPEEAWETLLILHPLANKEGIPMLAEVFVLNN